MKSVRLLVIVTTLLCLGVGGYAGQVWWSRSLASRILVPGARFPTGAFLNPEDYLRSWREWPYWGRISPEFQVIHSRVPIYSRTQAPVGPRVGCLAWVPRRLYYDVLLRATGESLPNDPDAWEAWFQVHPNLAWDERLNRLVDRSHPLVSSPR